MRPETKAADSEFNAFLRVGEINIEQVHRVRVENIKKFEINLNNYSAIIAGGSPFDVSCPENKKSVAQKNIESFFYKLFDIIIAEDFPFLGACSGNGLLGNYCGTKISNTYSEPIGSVTVNVTEEGEKDDLLVGLPLEFPVLVGHKEACDTLPQGAVLLASSKTCPVQMFRIKNNIYATQFHPESDIDEFILRISIYKNYGYFPPEQSEELIAGLKPVDTSEAKTILKRFVEKYKTTD